MAQGLPSFLSIADSSLLVHVPLSNASNSHIRLRLFIAAGHYASDLILT